MAPVREIGSPGTDPDLQVSIVRWPSSSRNGESWKKWISLKWTKTRQECPPSLLPFDIMLEVLANAIRQEKEIKYTVWEGRNKLFADDMIVKNPNELTKWINNKNPGTNSNYSKLARYRVNIHKLIIFLYTIDEELELEVKNTITFTKWTMQLNLQLPSWAFVFAVPFT